MPALDKLASTHDVDELDAAAGVGAVYAVKALAEGSSGLLCVSSDVSSWIARSPLDGWHSRSRRYRTRRHNAILRADGAVMAVTEVGADGVPVACSKVLLPQPMDGLDVGDAAMVARTLTQWHVGQLPYIHSWHVDVPARLPPVASLDHQPRLFRFGCDERA